jgi:DNA-directed RNA polymerase subunit RPC12/RpoP
MFDPILSTIPESDNPLTARGPRGARMRPMAIFFACEQCGHRVKAEDAHAGRRARCAHCGHKMLVPGTRISQQRHDQEDEGPEPEFRLAPIDDDPSPPPRVSTPIETAEIELQPLDRLANGGSSPRLNPIDAAPHFGAATVDIPEELLDDRAPIPLDPDFVPAPLSVGHDDTSQTLVTFRGHMYRSVWSILKKLEWFENWLYVVSLLFLMVAITGLLLQYRPVAHFGAVCVTASSLLLAALGGIEVIIKPFQLGIFGTSWKTMKKQIRHALAAFIPLIVLIAAYFFIKPIRDYFLETAEARQVKQMSSISVPDLDRAARPVIDARRFAPRT